jgi:hypothetical protein
MGPVLSRKEEDTNSRPFQSATQSMTCTKFESPFQEDFINVQKKADDAYVLSVFALGHCDKTSSINALPRDLIFYITKYLYFLGMSFLSDRYTWSILFH